MKKLALGLALILATTFLLSDHANAKGGFSSGGGGRSFSSGSSVRSSPSFSRPSTPTTSPKVAPAPAPKAPGGVAPPPSNPNRGGFNSGATGGGNRTTTTTTTTNRTVNRNYQSSPPVMYGGMGMGFGYTNGLLTGLIIGNMMHPTNTVVYSGPGPASNNALLYPDGRVVNQQGVLVGTYMNGKYTPIENGGVVAQAAPNDAYVPSPQPVVIKQDNTAMVVATTILAVFMAFFIFLLIIL